MILMKLDSEVFPMYADFGSRNVLVLPSSWLVILISGLSSDLIYILPYFNILCLLMLYTHII